MLYQARKALQSTGLWGWVSRLTRRLIRFNFLLLSEMQGEFKC